MERLVIHSQKHLKNRTTTFSISELPGANPKTIRNSRVGSAAAQRSVSVSSAIISSLYHPEKHIQILQARISSPLKY